jgi:hypothetical protein
MLFSTIVLHEGDAFEASARTRTLLHAFSAPPLTVAIEPMMSLLRIFSLRPVLSLEDIRWRFPRRVCFRSLVLGNDNSMIFSLQHGEAWEQAGSMREIRRVVDAADVRTSMWLSFRALLLSATAAAAFTRPPPTLPHLRVTIATRRGSDRGITNLMALVNITRSMSSVAEASAVAVRPPAAALVWSASLACDRQLHLRRLNSVTAAHERCLCLQLETLRVADQFQLLLSTHIFVSMISSAVCNAVCALNDSALEALVRKAVSAQTEFYPLKKCSKHPPLFHLVGASYCILHHQLGLGLICCRATVYMGKSCCVASLSTMCQIFMPAWSVITLLLPFDWGHVNDPHPKSELCSVAAQLTQHTVIVWQNMHRVLTVVHCRKAYGCRGTCRSRAVVPSARWSVSMRAFTVARSTHVSFRVRACACASHCDG